MSGERKGRTRFHSAGYEFVGKPSPRALATLRHHLRLRDRATSQAERDEIDLSIAILIGEEDERQRTAGAPGTTIIASDMVRLNDESGWQRLAAVWPWEVQIGGPRLVESVAAAPAGVEPVPTRPVSRPRGRPKGRLYERDALVAEYRRVRQRFGRRPTEAEFCASASPRIETRTLQEYLRAYGLRWPIE